METYQIFVVPMGNAKITEEIYFRTRAPVLIYQAREYLNDKQAHNVSVAPSDNIEEAKYDLWHQVIKYTKQLNNIPRNRS